MTNNLVDMLTNADRIIEVLPPGATTAIELHQHGCTRYLGLVRPVDLDRLRLEATHLADHFVPIRAASEITGNNADVLILHGRSSRYLWNGAVGRARLLVAPANGITGIESRAALRIGHRRSSAVVMCAGQELLAVPQQTTDDHGARRYASPSIGLGRLPGHFDASNIEYVVLRWFEDLPHLEAGEDLDILVRDEHLEALRAVLSEQPGTIPVDAYSESGLPGSDWEGVAYYPPLLAEQILRTAVRLPSGYRAPSPLHHFLSLAYHALYHKGFRSGLPTSAVRPTAERATPEHDYAATLRRLAKENAVDVSITMESLDELLAARRWRPPRDTLMKLARHNEWVRARFAANKTIPPPLPLLSVFLLRERAAAPRWVDLATRILGDHGFDVIGVEHISQPDGARAAAEIRGGNWGPGPFPSSGGPPAVVIVALDERPEHPDPAQLAEHPTLNNAHTLASKYAFRDAFLRESPPDQHCNPLHSSDDEQDAWEYLHLTIPGAVPRLSAIVSDRRAIHTAAGTPNRSSAARRGSSAPRASERDRRSGRAGFRTLARLGGRLLRRARRAPRAVKRAAFRRWARHRIASANLP